MSSFDYEALDAKGRTQRGTIQADSAKAARALLKEQGLMPVEMKLVQEKNRGWGGFQSRMGLSAADRALITRELAMMLSAGLPLERALFFLAEENDVPRIKRVISALRSRVLEGHALAFAMEDFPKAFPPVFQASVKAGEESGLLDHILFRLADHLESQQEVSQKLNQMLIYPLLMVVVSVGMISFLMTYVVPKMVAVFEDSEQTLPWLTQALVILSSFLAEWGAMGLLAMSVGILIAAWFYRHRLKFKRQVQHRCLRLPFVGPFWTITACARFARTLGLLMGAGVSAVDGMRYASGVMHWLPLEEAVLAAGERIRAGQSVHRALKETKCFPPLMIHLIASGEGSGQLDNMLIKSADMEDKRMGAWIATSLSIFEPCLILLMGGMVLIIVLAVLLPIFDMNQWVHI